MSLFQTSSFFNVRELLSKVITKTFEKYATILLGQALYKCKQVEK